MVEQKEGTKMTTATFKNWIDFFKNQNPDTLININFDWYNEDLDVWEILLSETYKVSDLLEKREDVRLEINEVIDDNDTDYVYVEHNSKFDYLGKQVVGIKILKQF